MHAIISMQSALVYSDHSGVPVLVMTLAIFVVSTTVATGTPLQRKTNRIRIYASERASDARASEMHSSSSTLT